MHIIHILLKSSSRNIREINFPAKKKLAVDNFFSFFFLLDDGGMFCQCFCRKRYLAATKTGQLVRAANTNQTKIIYNFFLESAKSNFGSYEKFRCMLLKNGRMCSRGARASWNCLFSKLIIIFP